jgi:hypothetical protein
MISKEIMGLSSETIDSSLGLELFFNANHNIANIMKSRYAVEGQLALTVDSSKEVRTLVPKFESPVFSN